MALLETMTGQSVRLFSAHFYTYRQKPFNGAVSLSGEWVIHKIVKVLAILVVRLLINFGD